MLKGSIILLRSTVEVFSKRRLMSMMMKDISLKIALNALLENYLKKCLYLNGLESALERKKHIDLCILFEDMQQSVELLSYDFGEDFTVQSLTIGFWKGNYP
jgi:hypothetical protein